MKKTVLTYGLALGVVSIGLLLLNIPNIRAHDLRKSDLLGYTAMVVTGVVVFLGVRSYRQKVGYGRLTFGRGFLVGLLITVISAACYAATFQVLYFGVMPDLGEKYFECMVERARMSNADIDQASAQARTIMKLYDCPVTNVALTFGIETSLGLLCSVLSAAILRKKEAPRED